MQTVHPYSRFTEFDIALFQAGKHFKLYEKFGAHAVTHDGQQGFYFAVWAPSAKAVFVTGDFNGYTNDHPLLVRWDASGIWEGFIPDLSSGFTYKFRIQNESTGEWFEKADPYGRACELPPRTASVANDSEYTWSDEAWMNGRSAHNALNKPFSVYEVHLGSWRRNAKGEFLTYAELASDLVAYVQDMKFTHVEFMPVMEYPYDPSWGYQLVGYHAPTSRFGEPAEFKHLVDAFHQAGIGVILDWVPSHFPDDAHGLGRFDGSALYEHPDRQKGYHPDWKSLIFNYERNEVRSFLISNALYWLDHYHVDGLRVDAVASMLYLDYSRKDGEWTPNAFGGRENLAAISFFKELNEAVYSEFPDVQTIAEESTSFPMVTRPTYLGGLGFGMKWMMGWMHDTLQYFKKDSIYRKYHQNDITFSMTYAFTENFMLPLSHDEVVYGKKSLLGRQVGDLWQQHANLRLMYGYMFTHPGAKLLFQGGEFGQREEWNFEQSLDWHLLQYPEHAGIQALVRDLNAFYTGEKALHEKQFSAEGMRWIAYDDAENSVLAYLRSGEEESMVVVCNMLPNVLTNYRIGVPDARSYHEVFNTDRVKYAGSGVENVQTIKTEKVPFHGFNYSVAITLPPLGMIALKRKN
jgi:1,4-alpha-glucan branching enzyme